MFNALKSILKKFASIKRKKLILAIMALIFLWMLSGVFSSRDLVSNPSSGEASILLQTDYRMLQDHVVIYDMLGVIDSDHSINLQSEVSGRVTKILVAENDMVSAGSAVIELNSGDKEARLDSAKANLAQQKIDFEAAKKLDETGYQAKSRLIGAKALLRKAEADLITAQHALDNSIIRAPFDLKIAQINVKEGSVVSLFEPLALVYDHNSIIVNVGVSEKDASKMSDKIENIMITLADGSKFSAHLVSLSRVPRSNMMRSYIAKLKLDLLSQEELQAIYLGSTASVKMPVFSAKTYNIPGYAIAIDEKDNIGMKIVDVNGLVKFVPVEIIDEDSNGFWVKSEQVIDNMITLITHGQAFVNDGEKANLREPYVNENTSS